MSHHALNQSQHTNESAICWRDLLHDDRTPRDCMVAKNTIRLEQTSRTILLGLSHTQLVV